MAWKCLYVFTEGNDDELFFDTVIRPLVHPRFDHVHPVIQYGQKTAGNIDSFLYSIQSMRDTMDADYLFLCDINDALCITAKKQQVTQAYKLLESDRVIVVIREIESWYLAGLDKHACRSLRIPDFQDTSTVNKEQFNQLMPRRVPARAVFLQQILEHFSLEVAKQKNASFRYLCQRLGI